MIIKYTVVNRSITLGRQLQRRGPLLFSEMIYEMSQSTSLSDTQLKNYDTLWFVSLYLVV